MKSSLNSEKMLRSEPFEISHDSDRMSWYALQIQSKLGSVASATLRGKGYEEFLPMYRSRRQWSDRIKELELPLFPGYLFCRFDVTDRLMPILTTPGVISIVGAGKTPLPVVPEEIEAVRAILRSGLAAQPWPFLGVGSKVYIERRPPGRGGRHHHQYRQNLSPDRFRQPAATFRRRRNRPRLGSTRS